MSERDEGLTAIPCGEPYEGEPPLLDGPREPGWLQPWSGFDPHCTRADHDCSRLPSQTANIKTAGAYDGIECGGNRWAEMAAAEARLSVDQGGGPFGAVIVQVDDETGAAIRYWRNRNRVTATFDPTAHAEVCAIRDAARELGVYNLGRIARDEARLPQAGATSTCILYASAEPCPMCYGAIYWARIPRLVFAATRYDAAVQGVEFSDEALYRELSLPYRDRPGIRARQATIPTSLDAFNLWKRSEIVPY
ncbi:nucleoside deaminase [Marinibaculum pumilum]|uniref:Nucleoside deaminase n=1 Tax=Marinibaculum pumilum TaxID=1766165 RepID=A0ABV7KX72_9PROT